MAGSLGYLLIPAIGDTTGLTFGSGSDVASAADAEGGSMLLSQATVAARPAYTTATPLDGHAALSLSFAGASQLTQASGGPTGANVPHYCWGIFSHGSGNTYCGVQRFGASGTTAINSFLGDNGASIWAGRGDNGAPVVADDASVHLVEKYFDGTNVWICRDGSVALAPTADSGYNIASAQFGLGGGYSGTADALVYAAGWGQGAGAISPIGHAARQLLGQWARRTFPSLTLNRATRKFGDSQTAGNGPVTPWPQRLVPLSLLTNTWAIDYAGATAGYKTTDVLAGTPYLTTSGRWAASGLRTQNVAVVWLGTNDIYLAGSGTGIGAATWANLQTICSELKADGHTVIIVTCMDRQQVGTPAWYATERTTLNNAIRSGYAAVADVLFDVAAMTEFSDSTNTTYFQADYCHLSQTGHDLFATRMAAVLNGFG